jgi:hypothetical protein
MNNLDRFFSESSPYSFMQEEKEDLLQISLAALDSYHLENCELYKRIVESNKQQKRGENIYLPVRLFKEFALMSIDDDSVFKVLTSSGTTSQKVSKIFLDRETAANQSKALIKIMQHFLGVQRLPMLIIDHPSVVMDRASFSARGAGILGLSNFGRNHTYALDDDMSINIERLTSFIETNRGKPIFIFGFTFMVWQYFFDVLRKKKLNLDLSGSTLVHSGGWKKLIDIAVDNETFKEVAKATCSIDKVHNFYGMVEQVGSIFVECDAGYLHAPNYADIDIINLRSQEAISFGEKGVVAVSSVLPSSYPGHRLLTEDLGTIIGEDDCACGLNGKYFVIHGRIPKAEVRGCSDTHAVAVKSA